MLSASLITTLVLPALVEALTTLQGDHSDVEDTRWCRCLKRRVEHAGMSLDTAPLKLQGQLQLRHCARKDFQQEVIVPTATAALHDDAVLAWMLL